MKFDLNQQIQRNIKLELELSQAQDINSINVTEIDELKASNMKLEQELSSVKTINIANATEIEDLTKANNALKRTVKDLTIQLEIKASEQQR